MPIAPMIFAPAKQKTSLHDKITIRLRYQPTCRQIPTEKLWSLEAHRDQIEIEVFVTTKEKF